MSERSSAAERYLESGFELLQMAVRVGNFTVTMADAAANLGKSPAAPYKTWQPADGKKPGDVFQDDLLVYAYERVHREALERAKLIAKLTVPTLVSADIEPSTFMRVVASDDIGSRLGVNKLVRKNTIDQSRSFTAIKTLISSAAIAEPTAHEAITKMDEELSAVYEGIYSDVLNGTSRQPVPGMSIADVSQTMANHAEGFARNTFNALSNEEIADLDFTPYAAASTRIMSVLTQPV